MTTHPYGVVTIHETCGVCGAKFDWQGDTWLGTCAADKFRKAHVVCREQSEVSNQDRERPS